MSWQDAHRYNRALREVAVELNWTEGTEIVWRAEYADVFGSPQQLLLALRSRLQTTLHAQLDDLVGPGGQPADVLRALAATSPGVVRALALPDAIRWVDGNTEPDAADAHAPTLAVSAA